MSPPRVVAHLDMDAFYAAIEVLDDPTLAGRPLIVGHAGPRGVVATCSYEARAFGVRSAMPSVTARRLCPDAVWRRGRMRRYVEISRAIRAILSDVAPVVEPLSIDEAFLDLTGLARDLFDGGNIGRTLKDRIRREQGLTASVGVAPNKFLAKFASDLEKPDGLVVFPPEAIEDVLWPRDVDRLWGVGPKTALRLRAAGFRTIGDLLRTDRAHLERVVGRRGADHLTALARGHDDRTVTPTREAKSVSEERTYGTDLTDPRDLDREILARAEGVARELRRDGVAGRTVHLKVRTADYTTWTRSSTLPHATDLAEVLVREARAMLRDRIDLRGRGVRLLGVGVSHLESAGQGQAELFPDPDEARARRAAKASDAVRSAMGDDAVTRARLLGTRTGRPDGDRPGPDDDAP